MTNQCNLNCPYCWQDAQFKKAKEERSLFGLASEPWVDDCVLGFRRLGVELLDLTGGEPLLRPVHVLIERLPQVRFALTTNATKEAMLDSIISMGNSRVVSITFSRHPSQDKQDVSSFWRLVQRSVNARIATTVNFVGWPQQLEEAQGVADVCGYVGCRFHFDPYVSPHWRQAPVLTPYQKALIAKYTIDPNRKKESMQGTVCCSAGKEHFMVSSVLDVYRCLDDSLRGTHSRIGNLLDVDLQKKIAAKTTYCTRADSCAGCDRDKVVKVKRV